MNKIKKIANTTIKLKIGGCAMMNFAKGLMIGCFASAGAFIMYNEMSNKNKKMMMKKGKKFLKNMSM